MASFLEKLNARQESLPASATQGVWVSNFNHGVKMWPLNTCASWFERLPCDAVR